jgi:Flp pilus assembly protein TadD
MTQTMKEPATTLLPTRVPVALLLTALGLALLAGCSSTSSVDLSTGEGQMKVGGQAARLGLWREAMFRFNRAVELAPGNGQAFNNLAVAYESNGEFEKAREAYLQALRLNRGDPHIQRNYSRFSEFYQRYEKAVTVRPDEAPPKPDEKPQDEPDGKQPEDDDVKPDEEAKP